MDATLERWASTLFESPLTFWVGGSLLICAIGANILWFFRGSLHRPLARWLLEAGRLFFYLVIPYLALGGWPQGPYQGLLYLEDMGIVGLSDHWPVTRWLEAAGVGLGLGAIALVLMVLGLSSANRRNFDTPLRFAPARGWAVLVSVIYLQVHWAFYRGALTVMWDDAYAGAFLGLGLVYLEWGLNPFWRQGWGLESRAAVRWLRASLALVITLLFLLSRNLWVCLAVHLLVEYALRQIGRQRTAPAPARLSPQQAEVLNPE